MEQILAPTVEEFLAARGELHLLAEIDRDVSREIEAHVVGLAGSKLLEDPSDNLEENDDDGYRAFVHEMWTHDGINLGAFALQRLSYAGPIDCRLHSLVEGAPGRLYLNVYEGGERKTYAADSRHRWFHDGHSVDYSAFIGIMKGADPNIAFKDAYPRSTEQAASREFDRFQTSDKRYVLCYRSSKGVSHRTVSRVIRYKDRFSARCHFRWGERRTFCNEGLVSVFDLQTKKDIRVESFLSKQK